MADNNENKVWLSILAIVDTVKTNVLDVMSVFLSSQVESTSSSSQVDNPYEFPILESLKTDQDIEKFLNDQLSCLPLDLADLIPKNCKYLSEGTQCTVFVDEENEFVYKVPKNQKSSKLMRIRHASIIDSNLNTDDEKEQTDTLEASYAQNDPFKQECALWSRLHPSQEHQASLVIHHQSFAMKMPYLNYPTIKNMKEQSTDLEDKLNQAVKKEVIRTFLITGCSIGDPHDENFLYDKTNNRAYLIDFGEMSQELNCESTTRGSDENEKERVLNLSQVPESAKLFQSIMSQHKAANQTIDTLLSGLDYTKPLNKIIKEDIPNIEALPVIQKYITLRCPAYPIINMSSPEKHSQFFGMYRKYYYYNTAQKLAMLHPIVNALLDPGKTKNDIEKTISDAKESLNSLSWFHQGTKMAKMLNELKNKLSPPSNNLSP